MTFSKLHIGLTVLLLSGIFAGCTYSKSYFRLDSNGKMIKADGPITADDFAGNETGTTAGGTTTGGTTTTGGETEGDDFINPSDPNGGSGTGGEATTGGTTVGTTSDGTTGGGATGGTSGGTTGGGTATGGTTAGTGGLTSGAKAGLQAVSEKVFTTMDLTPPTVVSVMATDATTVLITFSEPIPVQPARDHDSVQFFLRSIFGTTSRVAGTLSAFIDDPASMLVFTANEPFKKRDGWMMANTYSVKIMGADQSSEDALQDVYGNKLKTEYEKALDCIDAASDAAPEDGKIRCE